MARRSVRVVMVTGAAVAVGIAGVAFAQTSSGKTQDRLPMTQQAFAGEGIALPVRLAALDGPPSPPFATPPFAGNRSSGGPGAGPGPGPGPGPGAGPAPGPSRGAGPREAPGSRDRRPGPPRPDPLAFAQALAGAETAIGIRADQLDVWRDFTDALLASVPTPRPGGQGRRGGAAPQADVEPPAPFASVEALAAELKARGEAGERLARATSALREKLTPQQLQQVAQLGPALLPHRRGAPFPPPPPPFGPPAPGDEDRLP